MLHIYPDYISKFGIAYSSFANKLPLVYWANDFINEVSTVIYHFRFKKELFTTFVFNVKERSRKSC